MNGIIILKALIFKTKIKTGKIIGSKDKPNTNNFPKCPFVAFMDNFTLWFAVNLPSFLIGTSVRMS